MPPLDPNRNEAMLVLRAQLGDRVAVDELMRATTPWLRRYLTGILHDEDAAADILQDVLTIVWRRLGHVHEPRAFRAWAYRIATREAFRHLAKESRRTGRIVAAREDDHAAAETPTRPDPAELERLRAEIKCLTPNTRAVVALHYFEGLSLRHVAAVLGIASGTAKSRLAYALGRLRDRVRDTNPGPGPTEDQP